MLEFLSPLTFLICRMYSRISVCGGRVRSAMRQRVSPSAISTCIQCVSPAAFPPFHMAAINKTNSAVTTVKNIQNLVLDLILICLDTAFTSSYLRIRTYVRASVYILYELMFAVKEVKSGFANTCLILCCQHDIIMTSSKHGKGFSNRYGPKYHRETAKSIGIYQKGT